MNRREFLAGALASPLLPAWRAQAQSPIYTGDMHFHSFFADSKYNARPLAQKLAAGNTTLASMMTQLQGSGGCNAGGGDASSLLVLLAIAALVVRFRGSVPKRPVA